MYPASFDYHAPSDVPEAVGLLGQFGADAKVLAGGCSLIPLMKLRLAEPANLVDLRRIEGLRGVRLEGDRLVIGAMTREAEVGSSELIRRHAPLLAETSDVVADPLVRNMGTVGGNVAHADPANDHPATMLALGAAFTVVGPSGERSVPADDFFRDLYVTALEGDQLVTAITVPVDGPGSGSAYVKFERQVGDFPVVAAAARVTLEDGVIASVRLGLTNVAPTARRAVDAERLLTGRAPDDELLRDAGEAAVEGLEPWDELRGSAAYKLRLVPVAVRRALATALQRAGAADV